MKRPAYRLANRADYRFAHRSVELPAEREGKQMPSDAEEPRPGLSCPGLTRPDLSRPITGIVEKKNQNGKNPSPTSAFRCARANSMPCWACGTSSRELGPCSCCNAPRWYGRFEHVPSDGPGVYVLKSECGMVKIGVSTTSMRVRIARLRRLAAGNCWPLVCLEGAGYDVEHWLHRTLVETRDPAWARDEYLPHPSEWFWPSSALWALVWGPGYMVDKLRPEQVAA